MILNIDFEYSFETKAIENMFFLNVSFYFNKITYHFLSTKSYGNNLYVWNDNFLPLGLEEDASFPHKKANHGTISEDPTPIEE